MTSRSHLAAGAALALLLVGSLAACAPEPGPGASNSPTVSAPSTPSPVESETPATDPDSSPAPNADPAFGCTDAILTHLQNNGFAGATPEDAASFTIPDATVATQPDCYVVDEVSGATRSGAVWTTGIDATLAELGSSLTAAGYQQSDDFGPYVWWLNGTEPMTAEKAVGAAPQNLEDGTPILWASW